MANNFSPLEACRVDMFASKDELYKKYPPAYAERIMRLRAMYNYWLDNPSMKDRQLCEEIMARFGVSQSSAYSDINILHQLLPLISQQSRGFHLARANNMILETYEMAKKAEDVAAMARAVATYSKNNRVDLEDEQSLPYEDIVPQPYVPSSDPSLLGIKPIPDLYNHISRLTKELSGTYPDIEDVEYEDADLEENFLFAPLKDESDQPEG